MSLGQQKLQAPRFAQLQRCLAEGAAEGLPQRFLEEADVDERNENSPSRDGILIHVRFLGAGALNQQPTPTA